MFASTQAQSTFNTNLTPSTSSKVNLITPQPSLRSRVVMRRTYNRPLEGEPDVFETWEQTVFRALNHQKWLWERAQEKPLNTFQLSELDELMDLMLARECSLAGRTLWLGGTEISRRREASNFNCSALRLETVYDMVDAVWLLLNGCGVGGKPISGILNGFMTYIPELKIIRSERTSKGGSSVNTESWIPETKTWIIQIGDSAEAWAKAVGKLIAGKYPAKTLVIDLSQIRPAGQRLKGYGWISSGDSQLHKAMEGIFHIMNAKADKLLSDLDILDIFNWCGTILSSRRSAEIALMDATNPALSDFMSFKKDYYSNGNNHRAMSNNTILFWDKPSSSDILELLEVMVENGGCEPGFYNAEAASKRAPWFSSTNPCGEVLLGFYSFCNLVEVALPKYNGRFSDLERTVHLLGRANYRQTCVNLDDGILQRSWHELNQFLRLTGVGLTGITQWDSQWDASKYQKLKFWAKEAVHSMADELGLPRSKLTTLIKPSGTLSKGVFDCTEGAHKPLGRYIINNVKFGKFDPLLPKLKNAGYRVMEDSFDDTAVVVSFPVKYENVPFEVENGVFVNKESAVTQLERYKMLMENYVEHNASITISYSPEEVPEIASWLDKNWDSYVGVSFLFRNDPTKTAKDLGHAYLPQEVVTEKAYEDYVSQLSHVDFGDEGGDLLDVEECAGGVCPVR